jgi:hypothetical protein
LFIHPDIALQFAAERRREDERRVRLRNRPLPDRRVVRASRSS